MPVNVDRPPSRLRTTYSIHEAREPRHRRVVVLHHGICHTREHFRPLIAALNAKGIHVAMIDQQTEEAGWGVRNFIGLNQYRDRMAAGVRQIQEDGYEIGSYALHSMGARIGELMQQSYKDLRHPTAFLAPIPVQGAWPLTCRLWRKRRGALLRAIVTFNIRSLASTPQAARKLFFNALADEDVVRETLTGLKHASFRLYVELLHLFDWWYQRRVLEDFGQPRVLLYSRSDKIFHPQEYDITLARSPRLIRWRIRGGHDFFRANPEITARCLVAFHRRYNREPRSRADDAGSAHAANVTAGVPRNDSW